MAADRTLPSVLSKFVDRWSLGKLGEILHGSHHFLAWVGLTGLIKIFLDTHLDVKFRVYQVIEGKRYPIKTVEDVLPDWIPLDEFWEAVFGYTVIPIYNVSVALQQTLLEKYGMKPEDLALEERLSPEYLDALFDTGIAAPITRAAVLAALAGAGIDISEVRKRIFERVAADVELLFKPQPLNLKEWVIAGVVAYILLFVLPDLIEAGFGKAVGMIFP